jgi:ribonuclease P protein subunit POP4
MNALWTKYMSDLLMGDRSEDSIMQKMLRADMHGATIKVLKANCETYEGQTGIVIQETMRSFKIITPENRFISKGHMKENCCLLCIVSFSFSQLS